MKSRRRRNSSSESSTSWSDGWYTYVTVLTRRELLEGRRGGLADLGRRVGRLEVHEGAQRVHESTLAEGERGLRPHVRAVVGEGREQQLPPALILQAAGQVHHQPPRRGIRDGEGPLQVAEGGGPHAAQRLQRR